LAAKKIDEALSGKNFSETERARIQESIYKKFIPEHFRPGYPLGYLDYVNQVSKQGEEDVSGKMLVIVRLNILYDAAFRENLDENSEKVEDIVRIIVQEAQMYYWGQEVVERIDLRLIVVNLRQLTRELDKSKDINDIMFSFSETNPEDFEDPDRADLNVVFVNRHIWTSKGHPDAFTLGVAAVGSFCNKFVDNSKRLAVIRSDALGAMAKTFAHELGHALGLKHDGFRGSKIESKCDSESFIMAPTDEYKQVKFSKCSIEKLMLHLRTFWKCISNQYRVANAHPMNDNFDFQKKPRRQSETNLDRTCRLAYDQRSTGFPETYKGVEVCQLSYCILDPLEGDTLAPAGPALSGGECAQAASGSKGTCINQECVVNSGKRSVL